MIMIKLTFISFVQHKLTLESINFITLFVLDLYLYLLEKYKERV